MALNNHGIMKSLSAQRPLFHSEADFQHALAWQVKKELPSAQIRLEYRPDPDEPLTLDIWVTAHGATYAVELKYLTRKLTVNLAGERFSLKSHAAHNYRRYDVVKDLFRLEQVTLKASSVEGQIVVLTNDSSYWEPASHPKTFDKAFRLTEGRTLHGTLAWCAGVQQSSPARSRSLPLRGTYSLRWQDYSTVTESAGGQFRYLALTVAPP